VKWKLSSGYSSIWEDPPEFSSMFIRIQTVDIICSKSIPKISHIRVDQSADDRSARFFRCAVVLRPVSHDRSHNRVRSLQTSRLLDNKYSPYLKLIFSRKHTIVDHSKRGNYMHTYETSIAIPLIYVVQTTLCRRGCDCMCIPSCEGNRSTSLGPFPDAIAL